VYSQYVTGLIGPLFSRSFVCFRDDLLRKWEISSNQLIWCFCAAGSDDVKGIPKIGFKRALNACAEADSIANACKNLTTASNQAKRDLSNRIASYLSKLDGEPLVLASIPTTANVPAHDFIFETKEDGTRVRLHRLCLDPTAEFGIGLAPWVQFGRNLKESAKYQRPFQKVDESKAMHARTFTFRLESGPDVETSVELPLPVQQANQKKKRKSKKTKALVDEPAREVKKRTRNPEKQVLDRLSAFHMKCVRTLGSIKSLVSESISAEFVPWFQQELVNIKVINY
jgi:5'-3' exonuclease